MKERSIVSRESVCVSRRQERSERMNAVEEEHSIVDASALCCSSGQIIWKVGEGSQARGSSKKRDRAVQRRQRPREVASSSDNATYS